MSIISKILKDPSAPPPENPPPKNEYYLTFEEGNEFAVGFSNCPNNDDDLLAPEGFDPQIHQVRKLKNGKIELTTHAVRDEYEAARIEAEVAKSKKQKK